MWRIKYYDYMGLVDISFDIETKREAEEYAKLHSKILSSELKREVTYKISKA